LIIGEGPFECGHGRFDGGPRITGFGARCAGVASPLGEVERGLIDMQTAAGIGRPRLCGTAGKQGTIGRALEVGDEAVGAAPGLELGGLTVWADEALGLIRRRGDRFKVGQRHVIRSRGEAAKSGLNLHDVVRA
jgi:hypothetical protein